MRDAAQVLAHAAGPDFDARRCVALAEGLGPLELKARAMHVAAALEATLPAPFERAAEVIEAALAPPVPGTSMSGLGGVEHGLRGWILWPVGEFVARRGIEHPARALAVLHALTQRFTAEWAIRPFIVRHPGLTFETLQRWCTDPSPHVRRLASEGSRPRLPWGEQLKALIRDPGPTLPLLRALQDDPSEYVRRSVANHLNDIAKDHPELVVAWLEEHLPGAGAGRLALLRHASRTLVKQGHPAVLGLWGLGRPLAGSARLVLQPRTVRVGDVLALRLSLRSSAPQPQRLAVDYVVHHVRADGSTSAKVFKGWVLELPAHGSLTREKRHSLAPVTTRRYHAGRHRVELQVNGRVEADAAFSLELA